MSSKTFNKSKSVNNSRLSWQNFWKNNQLAISMIAVVAFASSLLGVGYNFFANQVPQSALASTEPVCQSVTTSPSWNPYPIQTAFPNPTLQTNNCQDMPLISFFPVDTASGNPREKTILNSQNLAIQLYYNNGAVPGSPAISNPNLKVQFTRISATRYRISATLEGSNTTSVNSAGKGGDLFVNVPANTRFDIVANSTEHYPDAIERRDLANTTGQAPNDSIPDNSSGSNVSNPIYSAFDGKTLTSTSGFTIKPNGLEAGFLGYGYVLTQIAVQTNPQPIANNPPIIPGQEITIVRGQSGSFSPLNPTDPDNDYPISLNLTQVPQGCSVSGTPNAQGGGQIITCQTNQSTPSRFTFPITPTDSRGLQGTPGTFIVNVIDPNLVPEKKCFVKNTTTECSSSPLKAGDDITYQVKVTNSSNVTANNVRVVDTYDGQRIGNITNISNNGQLNTSNSTITWANLGNLSPNASLTVTFDAKITTNVQNGDVVINRAKASADNIPEREVTVQFTIGGNLGIIKRCVAKGTSTPCSDAKLTPGAEITYQVVVTNSTASKVTNVVLTDTYDRTRLTDITNIQPSGQLNPSAGSIVWNLGDMNSGQSITASFDAKIASNVPSGTVIRNVAVVKADNIPDREATNEFPVAGPQLTAQKLCFKQGTNTPCNTAKLLPNDKISYIIRVTNTGTAVAKSVTLTDNYDNNRLIDIKEIKPESSRFIPNQGLIEWNIGDMNPGRTFEASFQATISANVPTGTTIVNFATIKSPGIPDIVVRVDFPVNIPIPQTPRTGGEIAFIVIALLIGLSGAGYYYYQKNNKFRAGFVPNRAVENKSGSSNNPSAVLNKILNRKK